MKPSHIIIHHSAVSRDKNNNQFDAIDNYHKSKGWGMIGYHFLIEPNGKLREGRKIGETGAHCRESLMNFRSIGICLTGNFDIEEPTFHQLETLTSLIYNLENKYSIPPQNIKAHRHFANYKSCPGLRFNNQLVQEIACGSFSVFKPPAWSDEAINFCKKFKILTKINGEHVPDYRLAVILNNYHKSFTAEIKKEISNLKSDVLKLKQLISKLQK